MSHPLPARWLAVVTSLVASAVFAQSAPPLTAPAPNVPAFVSAFDGYRAFADEQPIPWKEANDTVRQRGGWKAYAQEAQEAQAEPLAPTPTTQPGGPHAGHARPAAAQKAGP